MPLGASERGLCGVWVSAWVLPRCLQIVCAGADPFDVCSAWAGAGASVGSAEAFLALYAMAAHFSQTSPRGSPAGLQKCRTAAWPAWPVPHGVESYAAVCGAPSAQY